MDIDSAAKRKAAQGLPWAPGAPIPDGSIDDEDRAALAGVYGVGMFGTDVDTPRLGRPLESSLRRARYTF